MLWDYGYAVKVGEPPGSANAGMRFEPRSTAP